MINLINYLCQIENLSAKKCRPNNMETKKNLEIVLKKLEKLLVCFRSFEENIFFLHSFIYLYYSNYTNFSSTYHSNGEATHNSEDEDITFPITKPQLVLHDLQCFRVFFFCQNSLPLRKTALKSNVNCGELTHIQEIIQPEATIC